LGTLIYDSLRRRKGGPRLKSRSYGIADLEQTVETVSRLLAKFERENVIRVIHEGLRLMGPAKRPLLFERSYQVVQRRTRYGASTWAQRPSNLQVIRYVAECSEHGRFGFRVAGTNECHCSAVAKDLPHAFGTVNCRGGACAFEGLTRHQPAIGHIDGHGDEMGDLAHGVCLCIICPDFGRQGGANQLAARCGARVRTCVVAAASLRIPRVEVSAWSIGPRRDKWIVSDILATAAIAPDETDRADVARIGSIELTPAIAVAM